MPKLLEVFAASETRPVGFDEDETHAAGTTLRGGPNHDDHEITHLPVRDEGFLARHHVVIALAHRTGTNTLQVASGTRLGHGNGANGFAGYHPRQPFSLLFGASVTEKVAATHVTMHREVGSRTCEAGITEFFDDDSVVPKVSTGAAELFGHLRAEQAGRAAGAPQRPVDGAGVFPALKVGRDLRRRKAPYRLPELVVLFVVNRAMG